MTKLRNAAHAEQKAEVEVLCALAARMGEVSKKIEAQQSRLIAEAKTVRSALVSVHSDTKDQEILIRSVLTLISDRLQANTVPKDVNKLDAHIDKMLEPGQDKAKEERIIMAGWVTNTESGGYIAILTMSKAPPKLDLQSTWLQSSVLSVL